MFIIVYEAVFTSLPTSPRSEEGCRSSLDSEGGLPALVEKTHCNAPPG